MGARDWIADAGRRVRDWLDQLADVVSPRPEPVPVPVRVRDDRRHR